jgi:hypothetical protein
MLVASMTMSPYINASGIGIYHLIFYANGTNAIGCEFNGILVLVIFIADDIVVSQVFTSIDILVPVSIYN